MKLLEFIKIVFISFEAAFLLALFLAFKYFPDALQSVGHQFKTNSDVWKFIPTVPLIICGFSIQYAWKILNPLNGSSNRILHEWPDYWKLKLRVILSIFICILCVVTAAVVWIYASSLTEIMTGALFVGSCGVALIVACHELLAAFKIRELMEP